jgi:hypothetical protein
MTATMARGMREKNDGYGWTTSIWPITNNMKAIGVRITIIKVMPARTRSPVDRG